MGGGLVKKGLQEARAIGAEAIQFFAGNPRGWRQPTGDPHDAAEFRAACAESGLPVYVHAPYLLNFGSPDEAVLEKSAQALTVIMRRARLVGAVAVIVHAGSSVRPELREPALARLPRLFAPLLDTAPPGVRLLIEPTCGGGAALAATVDSTVEYFAALDDERIGLCIDTCHLHAAGEDLTGGLHAVVNRLTEAIGPGRLDLVHANDSRDPAGSHRDRHETLGKGLLGEDVFRSLFTIPQLHDIPVLVETATNEVDVPTLKRLRDEVRQGFSAAGSPGARPARTRAPGARPRPVE
ncbi:endonuclease IV [Nocardia tenerifensis]|uniref:Endonuclease IV n=1 Tax=Nocardia tenerifensis TaxID=228006 RepID=A0A318KQX1_9NOCA|nr:endonuclease IV [Nocardia tenerifensis]